MRMRQTFDPAFVSRISIAIRYPELSMDSRRVVWRKVRFAL